MSPFPRDLWDRAVRAIYVARGVLAMDPDTAVSRAYYAAFYAVSACMAMEGRDFVRHSSVEAAVHRDLVKTGKWPIELGADYSRLLLLRHTGDYGGGEHVSIDDAREAIEAAERILRQVSAGRPGEFSFSADKTQKG
jgi:uncharacterized protein (UPF0332 family)